jgi:CheY-like chemotaxis protein
MVDADRGLIEQVVMNLCVNARDAMPDGGRIVIRTDSACPLVTDHRGKTTKTGSHCRLIISDTGMGIPTEDIDHIFEPFFTTKEVGKGTGLGLATVYGVVQQHGGLIEVRSEVGKGTTFEISLPCAGRGASHHEGKAAPPAEGGSETILVAEDEQVVRDIAVRILKKGGYKVLTAEDGIEAVEIFRRQGDNIDMLLLDVVMPKMSGRAVYEQIRRMAPNIPALFTSGYDPDVTQPRFFHDHDKRLLTKPYSPDDLLRSVRNIIDSAAAQSSRTPVR